MDDRIENLYTPQEAGMGIEEGTTAHLQWKSKGVISSKPNPHKRQPLSFPPNTRLRI